MDPLMIAIIFVGIIVILLFFGPPMQALRLTSKGTFSKDDIKKRSYLSFYW